MDASSAQASDVAGNDADAVASAEVTGEGLVQRSLDASTGVKNVSPTPGAGWLDVPNAVLKPYCAAVRIDATHILTSYDCTTDTYDMRFGTGSVGEDPAVVTAVETMADEPRLASLELAEGPALDAMAEPTALDERPDSKLDGERVRGLSFDYAPRAEEAATWTFEGTLRADAEGLRVVLDATGDEVGAPNCHGDSGAGIYTEGGALVGLVVAVAGSSEDLGCVTELLLARP